MGARCQGARGCRTLATAIQRPLSPALHRRRICPARWRDVRSRSSKKAGGLARTLSSTTARTIHLDADMRDLMRELTGFAGSQLERVDTAAGTAELDRYAHKFGFVRALWAAAETGQLDPTYLREIVEAVREERDYCAGEVPRESDHMQTFIIREDPGLRYHDDRAETIATYRKQPGPLPAVSGVERAVPRARRGRRLMARYIEEAFQECPQCGAFFTARRDDVEWTTDAAGTVRVVCPGCGTAFVPQTVDQDDG